MKAVSWQKAKGNQWVVLVPFKKSCIILHERDLSLKELTNFPWGDPGDWGSYEGMCGLKGYGF